MKEESRNGYPHIIAWLTSDRSERAYGANDMSDAYARRQARAHEAA
jgi:hypothetical protein